MTAHASKESAVEALRLGAMDYLEKPFDELDLVGEKVDRAMENQRAVFEREALRERIRAYDLQLTEKNEEVKKRVRSENTSAPCPQPIRKCWGPVRPG